MLAATVPIHQSAVLISVAQVWHANEAPVSVERASRVHLREDGEGDGLVADQGEKEFAGLYATGLAELGGVNKSEPHGDFGLASLEKIVRVRTDSSQEAVTIEYLQHGNFDRVGRCRLQRNQIYRALHSS